MFVLMMIGVIGFSLSVIVHVSTFFGYSPLISSNTWVLNIGLAAVWLPILWTGASRLFRYGDSDDAWKVIPPYAMTWMKKASVGLLLYAFFNWTLTMVFLNQGGFPAEVDGQLVLHTYNFGHVIKVLTPAEFYLHQAYLLRAGSGHWIFMYFFGAVSAYSSLRANMVAGRGWFVRAWDRYSAYRAT